MANAVFPLWKQKLMAGTAGMDIDTDDATDGPFVSLIDGADYTYSSGHDFYNDMVAGEVGTPQRIDDPTVANGVFDGADVTFTAVTGDPVEILGFYRHNSGANSTWPLFLYLDASVTGLPVTPNGGNISITWHASGIFTLSDRRAKEDIEEVGSVAGVIPLHAYRYRGEEKRRLGFIAQEVEKIVPAAVIDLGRFKAVDYDRAVAGAYALAA